MAKKSKDKLLLRRLTKNVREQDWFMVAVEFFIVVFGVFFGLQAANWNEERLERQDESNILVRLRDETGNLLDAVRQEGAELQLQSDRLVSAQPVLFSAEPERPLTPEECNAIMSSHVYRKPLDELPILDELLSTGRFDRLQDSELRHQLRTYILFRDRARGNHEERTNELFRLYSRYPEMISIGVTESGDDGQASGRSGLLSADEYEWDQRCEVKAMRQSQPFLNDLFDNMARSGNVLGTNKAQESILVELHEYLSEVLNS